MKALSIRQPWAHLIANGIKTIENRTWRTDYRGPLLIHAGARWYDEPVEDIERRYRITIPRELPLGGIVGIADLVGILEESNDPYFVGPFGWVLKNALPLAFRAMPGQLGLFDEMRDG
jgi:hypothetical protein